MMLLQDTHSITAQSRASQARITLAVLTFVLSIYSCGGGVVGGLYYPAWKLVGSAEFVAFHKDMSSRLIPSFVAPFFLSVILSGFLVRFRPAILPVRLVVLAFALNLLILGVTIAFAIPIQMQLGQAQSLEAIDRLIRLDRPFRMLPGLILTAIDINLLFRLVRSGQERVQ